MSGRWVTTKTQTMLNNFTFNKGYGMLVMLEDEGFKTTKSQNIISCLESGLIMIGKREQSFRNSKPAFVALNIKHKNKLIVEMKKHLNLQV